MPDLYDITVLEPSRVRFARSSGGVLTMDYDGVNHPEVLLYRTFPLSMQTKFISARNSKGDEIGVIPDLAELDEGSALEAEMELRLRYLIPRVTQIDKINQLPGMWVWELQTTLGAVKMSMRNLHEHIQQVDADRLLLSDMDGNRCEIASIEHLDPASRKKLSRIL